MSLEELKTECESCKDCPLWESRTNLVFGTGSDKARLMFIGEAPGEQEDLQGIPFVGPAGKLLDDMLRIIDLSREHNCYIANIVKCRPPHNRDPLPEEEDACIGYLREQVRLIQPKIIVCLGRVSAMRLIKPDYRITRDHGTFIKKGAFLMTAVYHPAALLRDPRKKDEMLADMMAIKERIDREEA